MKTPKHDVFASKDKKYQTKIVKSIKKEAGKFANVCTVSITTKSNNQSVQVYNKSNSAQCTGVIVPPQPTNKPPVLVVDSPIKCIVDNDCTMTVESVKDPEGSNVSIAWSQKSGVELNFTVNDGSTSATIHPVVNDTYVFSVIAKDDKNASTSKDITVNVGSVSPPPPQPCPTGTHDENGTCVPDPQPPSNNVTKIAFVGDFSGTSVRDAIKKSNPDFVFALGDLTYGSDLASYKTNYVNVFGSKSHCVIGNHDSPEDGSASIYAEAKALCGESYVLKIGNTQIVAFNSNGDINAQVNSVKDQLTNSSNSIIISHKNCEAPPNAHHPVESSVKAFCTAIDPVLTGKVIHISGHNHGDDSLLPKNSYMWFRNNNNEFGRIYICAINIDSALDFDFKLNGSSVDLKNVKLEKI